MEIPKSAVAILAIIVIGLIMLFTMVGFKNVEGSERVVWQYWSSGVSDDVATDGVHPYITMITDAHEYYIGADTFIIGNDANNSKNSHMDKQEQQFNDPDMPPIVVPVQMEKLNEEDKSAGKTPVPTDVTIKATVRFYLDEAKLVLLHKQKTKAYRTNLIQPVLRRVIIDNVTKLDARTVFLSGRTELQVAVENSLKDHPDLNKYGVIIEEFVLDSVELNDKDFVKRMQAEAIAEQRSRTAKKETEAALQEAIRTEAEAKAEQNKRLVEAETKKQEEIAIAEASKQKQILAAEADAEKVRVAAIADAEKVRVAAQADMEKQKLEGEGLKLRKVAEADGVLALGKAEAEAKKLILAAYQGEGGLRFAEVEKAKHLGAGIQKIYYIPESLNMTAISGDFNNAIKIAVPSEGKSESYPANRK